MKKDVQPIAKETNHTPGEWVVNDESICTKDGKYCIAVIEADGGYEAPFEQREANARLIAAAPDLLAALERLLKVSDLNLDICEPETSEAIEHAGQILAKARGEKY